MVQNFWTGKKTLLSQYSTKVIEILNEIYLSFYAHAITVENIPSTATMKVLIAS